jgi:hypothetical protein
MGSYLRTLPSNYSAYKYNAIFDDDIISLTSTEVDDSIAYQSTTPYNKTTIDSMVQINKIELLVYLRNKSSKLECVRSFNMDWRILVFYPEPESRDKIY